MLRTYKIYLYTSYLFVCLFLSGCGLHIRSAGTLSGLHSVYIETDTPKDPLIEKTRRMLTALQITVTPEAQKACFILSLNKVHFSHTQYTENLANTPVNITYTLSVNMEMRKNKTNQSPDTRIKLLVSETLTQNSNQLNTYEIIHFLKPPLRQALLTKIYAHLFSFSQYFAHSKQ